MPESYALRGLEGAGRVAHCIRLADSGIGCINMQEVDCDAAYIDSEAPVIDSAPAQAEPRAATERSQDRIFVSNARFVKRDHVFSSPCDAVVAREGPVAVPRASNVRRRCINLERDAPVVDTDCIEIVADDADEQREGAGEDPDGADQGREGAEEAWEGAGEYPEGAGECPEGAGECPEGAGECPEGADKDRERADEVRVGPVGKKKGGECRKFCVWGIA